MSSDASIHDNFIRSILSNKSIAVEYFKNYLPAFISSRLNFSTLRQLPDTYLSEDLKKTMSDIVYSCRRKGTKEPVKVSLLVEHKSYPDKYTPIQIGSYIFSALQKQAVNKEPLSLVIPVLLYHGKGKWQYRNLADLFEETDKDWQQYIPNFEYVYNNLGVLNDEAIERLNNKFLAASVLALKHSVEKEWLEQNAGRLLILASQGPGRLQKGFIIYLFSRASLEGKKILNSLPVQVKEKVMNTLDIYIEKGRKEGLEKGRKEGLEKGLEKGKEQVVRNLLSDTDFTIARIASLANVTEAFVRKVRSALK